jgi:hypothetical protein
MGRRISVIFVLAFVVLFLANSVSALTVTGVPSQITGTSGHFTVNISSDTNTSVAVSVPSITQGTGVVSFSVSPSSFSLNTSANHTASRLVNVNYSVSDPDGYFNFLDSVSYSTSLKVNGQNYGTIYFKNTDFCQGTPNVVNILKVDSPDFSISSGYGDSSTWYLLDNVSAKVDVENNGNYDLRNVKVQWALYTTDGNKIDSGTLSSFSLNSGNDKTVDINFQLNNGMNRIDNAGGNVVLYVKASGTIRDTSANGLYDGNQTCSSVNENGYVETGDDFMIPVDVTLNGNILQNGDTLNGSVSCGSNVNLAGTIYNIGSSDQSSGSYVVIYNQELGVNQIVKLGSISAFSSQDFSANFNIPKNASEKIYGIQLSVYDSNNNLYENSNNDQAVKTVFMNVSGNCAITPPTVTADISSGEATEGKQVTVHVYVRNEDAKTATFVLAPSGYNSWADLVNISAETFTLGSGYSKDVYMTFNLKSGSAGSQNFNIILTSNGQIVSDKQVNLTVAQGSFWSDLGSNVNWEIVGIVLLNVVLLVAIIIVAVKILKRR